MAPKQLSEGRTPPSYSSSNILTGTAGYSANGANEYNMIIDKFEDWPHYKECIIPIKKKKKRRKQ